MFGLASIGLDFVCRYFMSIFVTVKGLILLCRERIGYLILQMEKGNNDAGMIRTCANEDNGLNVAP
jgi:hypothetical protein